MSIKAPGSGLKVCSLLLLIICNARSLYGLKQPEKGGKTQAKSLDDTVVKDLMQAVDKHFEKLTARIGTLESTVSSMQFYSIRQFSQISGSLHSTNNDLGTVRKQVSQMEIDGRSQKIGLSLLSRDISELKKTASDMLSELESSMVYVHENIDKQDSLIKTVLEDTVIQTARETTAQMSKQMEEMLLSTEAMQTKVGNCSTDFSSVIEHIDVRFLELKKQNHAQLMKQINVMKLDMKKNLCAYGEERGASKEKPTCDSKNASGKIIGTSQHNENKQTAKMVFEDTTTHSLRPLISDTTSHVSPTTVSASLDTANELSKFDDATQNGVVEHTLPSNLFEATSSYLNTSEYRSTPRSILELLSTQLNVPEEATVITSSRNISTEASSTEHTTHIPHEEIRTFQAEEDEKVMKALYNMTTSVLQAVSYFRNTGRLLEQILSNTDMLVVKQNGQRERIEDVGVKSPSPSNYGDYDSANVIPGSEHLEEAHRFDNIITETQSSAGENSLSRNILAKVATLVTNGSQLLEVITDLAQMSSVSLIRVTSALEDEVKRLEGLKTHMATTFLNKVSERESESVNTLTNATQRTFKLVEAVASNTGWIPLIFHNVQHLESLANRSLHLATQSQKMISQVQQKMANSDSNKGTGLIQTDPTISNRIPRTLGQAESSPTENASSKFEDIFNRKTFETLYRTSLQLNRLMPGLTKLLSERGPLITLVGGSRQEEGRVEIYHKGLWGALCHGDLTHAEADSICRHLGFEGGVSAGAGYFGPGSGVTWLFNSSCLGADNCPLVAYSEEYRHCSHDLDAAVVCDHMLRIVSSNGSNDTREGRLEIHHRNAWLPVCGDGWTDNCARVACQQMGFSNGTWLAFTMPTPGTNSTWLGKITCTGLEARLDVCPSDGWTDSCSGQKAAGVSCL
ncbi:hypothetical protein BsWGS_04475 [Bradybaena similaris]